MNNDSKISGIRHITAIASSAAKNLAFYENVLGLRLVKKTINFDEPKLIARWALKYYIHSITVSKIRQRKEKTL